MTSNINRHFDILFFYTLDVYLKLIMDDDSTEESSLRFIELESLQKTSEGYFEWKEKARWIKLEEDIEEGSGRWSKPYIPNLSYKTINDLRLALQEGDLILDVESTRLDDIASELCNCLVLNDVIQPNFVSLLYATILAKHHHYHQRKESEKSVHLEVVSNLSNISNRLLSVASDLGCIASSPDGITSNPSGIARNASGIVSNPGEMKSGLGDVDELTVVQFLGDSKSAIPDHRAHSHLLKCMPPGSEATIILVANVPYAQKVCVVFVRLRQSAILGNLTEISLPVRFLYLVIGPESSVDCYQIGRALGLLSSNEEFWNLVTTCTSKDEILLGIDRYLLSSSVIPDGQWDSNIWTQSLSKWNDSKDGYRRRSVQRDTEVKEFEILNSSTKQDEAPDPLTRTGAPFGGLIQDIKRKIPFFLTDFTDALNARCLVVVIIIYFSFLAPAITFAAIMSDKTEGLLGISEMIVSTSVCGIIFGIFAGQPLIILGATGPVLVMEQGICQISRLFDVELLAWRVWIGFWIVFFCTLIVAFDMCFLVKYFTLFTEEIVTSLISVVFVFESFRYVYNVIVDYYLIIENDGIESAASFNKALNTTCIMNKKALHLDGKIFMTIVLLFGTALFCDFFFKIRHTRYFSSHIRRLLSDFGILLTVCMFTLFDYIMKDNYTTKLDIPDGFTPTSPSKRGWVINIMGSEKKLGALEIVLASIPGFFVTIILFMETELTGTILDRKRHRLVKGSGYNLDLFVVGILASLCSIFGLPWMCACPVHSMAHLSSLFIFSTNHVPGTSAKVVRVIEQRVTNILMHVLIGLSVFLAPFLRKIPFPIILGVFLYLGVTALSHLKLTERFKLLFIPPDHHPDIAIVRKLKTKTIHLFTCIQLACLAVVTAIENTLLAPTFPFFILLTVPLRRGLNKIFTEDELYELDNLHETSLSKDVNEYDLVHVPM